MLQRQLLVIDDQADLSHIIRQVAEPMGYFVATPATPEEGIDIFKAGHFDVIMLDILMPNKDGIEVLQELMKAKSRNKDLPQLILMSGSSDIYLSSAMKIARGFGWENTTAVSKPLRVETIQKLLQSATPVAAQSAS